MNMAVLTDPHLLAAVVGYLLGSIPFGMVMTRIAGLGDVRNIGSGNIGATNVLRTGRKGLAAATLLLDGAKGAAAVMIAGTWGSEAAMTAGLLAVIGHNFPIWLKFRGGKGVATTIGVLSAISWPVGIMVCLSWIAVAAVTRYSSLAALLSLAASPVYMYFFGGATQAIIALVLAVLSIFRHHQNISRLVGGKEAKIGDHG